MSKIKQFIKNFKIKITVKRVNRALKIKLTDWQIGYIFHGQPYSDEIYNARCNGKTLAHILRICLKTDAKTPEPLEVYIHSYENESDVVIFSLAGEDRKTSHRRDFFKRELYKTYMELKKYPKIKLRNIEFKERRYIKVQIEHFRPVY